MSAIAFKRPDGSEQIAVGRYFVIAAHGVETPRLLLMSRSERFPDGVANSSGQVGRNLMDHPVLVSLALAHDPVYPYRGPGEISGIEHLRDGPFRTERAAFRTPIGNDGWSFGGESLVALARTLIGRGSRGVDLYDALAYAGRRQVRLAALLEQLPDQAIESLSPIKQMLWVCRVQGSRMRTTTTCTEDERTPAHSPMSCSTLWAPLSERTSMASSAPATSWDYRMGTDATSSVVDPVGRAHDHSNLFLIGSGVFPTGGTANPTLTLAALALMTAAEIAKSLSA